MSRPGPRRAGHGRRGPRRARHRHRARLGGLAGGVHLPRVGSTCARARRGAAGQRAAAPSRSRPTSTMPRHARRSSRACRRNSASSTPSSTARRSFRARRSHELTAARLLRGAAHEPRGTPLPCPGVRAAPARASRRGGQHRGHLRHVPAARSPCLLGLQGGPDRGHQVPGRRAGPRGAGQRGGSRASRSSRTATTRRPARSFSPARCSAAKAARARSRAPSATCSRAPRP